jgi:alcohol dehydrogenase
MRSTFVTVASACDPRRAVSPFVYPSWGGGSLHRRLAEEARLVFENDIDIGSVFELRTRTTCYFGVGAIQKIADVAGALRARGIRRVIAVCGRRSYRETGAWDVVAPALAAQGIEVEIYDEVTPNPIDAQVDAATRKALAFGAQAVIAVGGGSPIDAGKSVAILLRYPQRTAAELYTAAFTPTEAAPLVAVNTTHGTGTEVDRFAVMTVPSRQFKPAIAYDCAYPLYSIDDPALMADLPRHQSIYVSVDALNHVVEACSSRAASPFSILLAKETTRLVAEHLPQALRDPKDLRARYYLLYASAIAGIGFDNGLLHLTHALEHPLSAVKQELAHGLGLGMLLPAVVQEIYAARSATLAEVLAPLVPGLKGTPAEAVRAAEGVEAWLEGVGLGSHLADEGFTAADLDHLTELAFTTPSLGFLLSLAPVEATRERVRHIYERSLRGLRAPAPHRMRAANERPIPSAP